MNNADLKPPKFKALKKLVFVELERVTSAGEEPFFMLTFTARGYPGSLPAPKKYLVLKERDAVEMSEKYNLKIKDLEITPLKQPSVILTSND
jgi:hypothetical protein